MIACGARDDVRARHVDVDVRGLALLGTVFDSEELEKQGRVDGVADRIEERFRAGARRRGSQHSGEKP